MANNNPTLKVNNNLHFSNKNIHISTSTMAVNNSIPKVKIIKKNVNVVLMMNAELCFKKEKAKAATKNKKVQRATKAKGKASSKVKAINFIQQQIPTKRSYLPDTLLQTQPEDVGAVYQPWDDIMFGTHKSTAGFRPEDSCMGCLLATCQRASYVATAVGIANSLEGANTTIMNNRDHQDWFISIYNGVKKVYSDSTYGIQCARLYAAKTWPTIV